MPSAPLEIALIGPFPWPSHQGSQAYLKGQAIALADRGHHVSLFVYGGGQGGELHGIELIRGSPGARFSNGGLHWSRALADIGIARALRQRHRRRPFDLIHAHQVEGPLIARLAGLGLPVVYDLHTSMEEELPDHLPWGGLSRRIGRAFDSAAVACADAGCAISARASGIFEKADLPHLQVGPSVDPAELVAPIDPTPRVVYTGNLDTYQDLDLLYAQLPLPVPLWVVTGSDGTVPHGVHVVRDATPQAAIHALSGAMLAVIPRRQVAGFPIKLLNQLGMGVPTVVIDGAGLDVPGTVPSTPERLGSTLSSLIHDGPRRQRLGRAGRKWVLQHCTPSARAEALERLYRRTLGA